VLRKGFRGVAIFTIGANSKKIRFANADVPVSQEAVTYAPAIPGRQLRRITRRGTADLDGSMSLPLTEGKAEYLYDLCSEQTTFKLELHYYSGVTRKYEGCQINTMRFQVVAGEVVNVNIGFKCETVSTTTDDYTFTKGEKLVTWDKCSWTFLTGYQAGGADQWGKIELADEQLSAFEYVIDNDIKTIKTNKSLFPTAQNPAVQNVTGNLSVYNFVIPDELPVNRENGLIIPKIRMRIDDLEIEHQVALYPANNNPLTPETIVSTILWVRVDDFA
jgi:hypothetical protein